MATRKQYPVVEHGAHSQREAVVVGPVPEVVELSRRQVVDHVNVVSSVEEYVRRPRCETSVHDKSRMIVHTPAFSSFLCRRRSASE
jgi:hypothetical protein